jgi:predicted metal-dependent peptidase
MTLPLKPKARERVEKARELITAEVTEDGYRHFQALRAAGVDIDSHGYRRAAEYALTHLYENRPFYAHFFSETIRISTFKTKTMEIRIKNARIELRYNPDFVALFSPAAGARAFQHEAGHVFGGHIKMYNRVPKKMWREPAFIWAKELAVNTLIRDIVDYFGFTIVPGDLSVDALEHKDWEYYYELLKENTQLPAPEFDAGGEWDQQNWTDCDNADIQAEVIKQTVGYALRKAEGDTRNPIQGYMPGDLVDRLRDLLKTKAVPFERLFRSYIGSQIKTGRRPTIMRLSKRRHVPPGHTFVRHLRAIWYQDDSGSMAREEMALGRSECHNAMLHSGVSILFQRFCGGLVGDMVDLDVAPFSECMRTGTGGTDFDCIVDHAHVIKPDLMLVATDGGASIPRRRPPCPIAWILTHDGAAPEWGTIIRLPSVPEIKRGYRAVVERWSPW